MSLTILVAISKTKRIRMAHTNEKSKCNVEVRLVLMIGILSRSAVVSVRVTVRERVSAINIQEFVLRF